MKREHRTSLTISIIGSVLAWIVISVIVAISGINMNKLINFIWPRYLPEIIALVIIIVGWFIYVFYSIWRISHQAAEHNHPIPKHTHTEILEEVGGLISREAEVRNSQVQQMNKQLSEELSKWRGVFSEDTSQCGLGWL
jgi:type VI protein secretion system component VasK